MNLKKNLHNPWLTVLFFTFTLKAALGAQTPTPPPNVTTIEDPNIAAAADLVKPGTPGPEVWDGKDTPAVVDAAGSALSATPAGSLQPTWDSIKAKYQTPAWFTDGKFGIFMHWGIYSVPAHQSEWYVRYMYGGNAGVMQWHTDHFGPPTQFGYKDFIPMFTAAKWNPDAWAELFKKAGAKYIIPTAEHHDGFSLWDSAYNKYNAKNMGPHRDLIGDLATAVRKVGLKFGVSNHSANHFNFIPPLAGSDQYDPAWADFYSVADRSPEARQKFNDLWVKKNLELIDKYQPDMLWFDGIGGGISDAMKLVVASHYFTRAAEWGKEVSISGKYTDFPAGAVLDYERQGRIEPRGIKNFAWQVDDPMGNKFAYVTEIQYKPVDLLIHRLIDCVSMNGNYLMNISPMADGTIPQAQQERLLAMGKWLDVNGEAIYGTRAWTRYGEGPYYDAPAAPWRAPGPDDPPNETYTAKEIRFTTKGDALYAIVMDWPGEKAVITSLATGSKDLPTGKIVKVELLGHSGIMQWHTEHYGPPTKFGYKDFIPMFTAAKWDPDAWAALFKKAGAKYVLAPGEHHDGFSNWDSAINKYNAKNMGPKRDLVGDLLTAVRKVGLKTGVSNHSNPHFNFIPALPGSDQYDPEWAAFYSVANRSNAARTKFLETWVTKNMELVDKYQPDMLWFDQNGDDRSWDPLKVRLLAYYYNRAAAWGKQVTVSAKGESYLSGMVIDYERQGRAPKELTDYTWQPDDPITDKFGYVEGQPVKPASGIIPLIVINVSRNGNYLLNISPKADGTIPDEQQQVLLAIGKWMDVNGEAIYSSRPWKISEEGSVHFTTKGDTLYAISLKWPTDELVIPALGTDKISTGKIEKVELLGAKAPLAFTQDAAGLHIKFPVEKPCDFAYSLKITGLKLGK